MRKKVEDAEAKVEDFRAKANLLVGTNNTTLSAQQLGEVNSAACRRARAKGRRRGQGQDDPRHAALRPADRKLRYSQFGSDSPACRAARHVARAACRAVVDAARLSSAHQGIEGADRRSRRPDQGRGGNDRAVVRKRRQARRRAGGFADGDPRSAQEPGGVDQRAGRAIARARARRQVAARSAGILSRQISRGDVARHASIRRRPTPA